MGREEASVGSNGEEEVSHGVGRIRDSSKGEGVSGKCVSPKGGLDSVCQRKKSCNRRSK